MRGYAMIPHFCDIIAKIHNLHVFMRSRQTKMMGNSINYKFKVHLKNVHAMMSKKRLIDKTVRRIPRKQLEGGSRKRASYSEILERCWRHTLQAKPPRRGKTLTSPHLQPAQSISTSH
jgi:hypothetical protein